MNTPTRLRTREKLLLRSVRKRSKTAMGKRYRRVGFLDNHLRVFSIKPRGSAVQELLDLVDRDEHMPEGATRTDQSSVDHPADCDRRDSKRVSGLVNLVCAAGDGSMVRMNIR